MICAVAATAPAASGSPAAQISWNGAALRAAPTMRASMEFGPKAASAPFAISNGSLEAAGEPAATWPISSRRAKLLDGV